MDRFQALRVFSQVVAAGSFWGAAEKLGRSTAAASRHVAELEAHLQTRLLNRTTRRVSLTESGRTFYERAVQLLADLAEAEQEASRAPAAPRGTAPPPPRAVQGARGRPRSERPTPPPPPRGRRRRRAVPRSCRAA